MTTPSTEALKEDGLARLKREIAHQLAHRLEHFSNGHSYPPSKTDGFTAAKVADWQLRQWLALIDEVSA